ncbi:hypothetical protein KFE98_01640 [bacterium SCSIO 12741]|nr:hypothetical protein KFE98_01640 [bacterium SCSIO 12741]
MISLKQSEKTLNSGKDKFSPDQVAQIRDFFYQIARIQVRAYLDDHRKKQMGKKSSKRAA